MTTCFKFKDIIDITYHSSDDCLYLSLSDNWLQKNSIFNNSKDYILEYEKRTTDNPDDLENNIVSVILKLYHDEDFCYISGCYFEHFVSNFNKKIGAYDYDCEQRSRVDWDSFLRVFKKQPLLKFTELIIGNSDCEQRSRDDSLPLSKFTSLIQVCSDGFFLDSTYAVISCLYTLCNGLSVPLVTESGFKLEMFIK